MLNSTSAVKSSSAIPSGRFQRERQGMFDKRFVKGVGVGNSLHLFGAIIELEAGRLVAEGTATAAIATLGRRRCGGFHLGGWGLSFGGLSRFWLFPLFGSTGFSLGGSGFFSLAPW